MKMFLAPRPIHAPDTSARNEESIECKFLGQHREQLVTEVLIPTAPQRFNQTNINASSGLPKPPRCHNPGMQWKEEEEKQASGADGGWRIFDRSDTASKPMGRRGNPLGAVVVSSNPEDAAFRRELEQRDVPFLQRLSDADKSVRVKNSFRRDLEPKDAAFMKRTDKYFRTKSESNRSMATMSTKSLMDGVMD